MEFLITTRAAEYAGVSMFRPTRTQRPAGRTMPSSATKEPVMMRTTRHGFLVVCLSLAFAALVSAQQDFSKVEIKTTKLAGNLYQLEGQGGHIGVLAGEDGVLMVDSQFAPLTERIVAAIRAINSGPIRFLINTHLHGDHTGGNANLAGMGATIIARPQLRARLEKPNPTAS